LAWTGDLHVHQINASQPSEPNALLSDALTRGSGGWELVASPVVFGLLGWLADRALGIVPILTVLGVLVGLSGAVVNQYSSYKRRMNTLADNRRAERIANGEGSGPRFAPTAQVDLPTYVLESDLATEGENA